jgi:mitogen-activated protein kinase 1/3
MGHSLIQAEIEHFSSLESRYEVYKTLGKGSFGVVVAARTKTGQKVAIKKIHYEEEDDEQAKLLLRELKLLRHFRGHENIIHVRDVIGCRNDGIYIVTNLMESDLSRVIHSKQDLTDEHLKFFTYQILRGLKYLHSAKVMHRDLKPTNLLVNSNCDLRICDLVHILLECCTADITI